MPAFLDWYDKLNSWIMSSLHEHENPRVEEYGKDWQSTWLLILSSACFLFFGFIVANFRFFQYDFFAIGFVQNLLTIPFILLTIVLFVVLIFRFVTRRVESKGKEWLAFGLIVAVILLLIGTTIW